MQDDNQYRQTVISRCKEALRSGKAWILRVFILAMAAGLALLVFTIHGAVSDAIALVLAALVVGYGGYAASPLKKKKKKKKKRKNKCKRSPRRGSGMGSRWKPTPPGNTANDSRSVRLAEGGAGAVGDLMRGVRGLRPPDPCEYRVWFGTDRQPRVPEDYAQGFTRRFDTRLHFGSCVVYVPKSHDLGSTGSNVAIRCIRVVAGLPKDEPLKLLAVEQGSKESFVCDLAACMAELDEADREILLFVHGYNVNFEDAAIRAAQVGRDLGITWPVVFFSWPSFAFAPFYTPDEATVDRTRRQFVQFVRILQAVPRVRAVNVIAHSMGNRILEQTANVLVESSGPEIQLGHIVLAAPDVDRAVILQAAKDYARLRSAPRRTTLYWNRRDRAVGLSGLLHHHVRGGTYGAAIPHTDSILWSKARFNLDLLGHGYFAEAEEVLQDIRELLTTHAAPHLRPRLTPVPSDCPQYWMLGG